MTTTTEEKSVRQKITHSFLLLISMLSGLFDCNVNTFAAIKILPIRWGYFRCEAGTFTLKKTGIPCRAVACEKGRSSTELNAYLREGQICCSLDILEADPCLSPVLAVLYTIFAMTNSTLINFPAYVRFRNFPKEDTLSSELNFSFESAPPIVGRCYACFCTNRADFGLNG